MKRIRRLEGFRAWLERVRVEAHERHWAKIVRDTAFRPSFDRDDETFEMSDLIFFAYAGKRSEINPLGGK
jgi:hypothetical protein